VKLTRLAQAIALLGMSAAAFAQSTPEARPAAAKLERVEVTGSSIKRIAAEGALPLQVITREDIARVGITSAEQLVAVLAANSAGVDNMTANQGGDFLNSTSLSGRGANNGSAAVSLRGLGPQNTLVLLNGRRVSTHGLNGKSVDLNSIPLAAVERIEILKDGASAIYGTDAIGGVMNFILRKSYEGLEVSGLADITEASGGNIFRGSVLGGLGNIDQDGYNVMASVTYESQRRLRGSQRDFHNGYQPDRGLAPDTTGTPFATINAAAGTALPGRFTLPGSDVSYNRVNLLALTGECNTIANQHPYRGDITGFDNNNQACSYDYGKDWSLMQPVDRLNLVSRGTLKLNNDHQAYAEFMASRVTSEVQYTPNQITTVARGANYPVGGPYYQDLTGLVPGFDNTQPIRLRWRCLDCGFREQETTSDVFRILVGTEGLLSGWDYKWGLSYAKSEANTDLIDGNLDEAKFKAAMDTGLINPFLRPGEQQTPEAMALIRGANFRGSLYGGESTVAQVDATGSREIYQLPAGPLMLALGTDLRRETYRFNESQSTQPVIIGVSAPAALDSVERDVAAVYGELLIPIVKDLEAQVALRYDHYSDFGSTTNPKVGLRWAALPQLMFRGSYSEGFHAPDFGPLYEGSTDGQFTSDVNDPLLCPGGGTGEGCNIRPGTRSGGNPDLKPETSKQFSIGFVVAPTDWLSASVDYFDIEIDDRISFRTPQEVLDKNLTQYIVRNPAGTGPIDYVQGGWINVGGDKVRGADLNLTLNFLAAGSRWQATFDGTYLDSYKVRKSDVEPWSERVGRFGDFEYGWDLKQRWRHTLALTWSQGPWTSTVANAYSAGYDAEVDGYGSGVVPPNYPTSVDSYSLWNASVGYNGFKDLSLQFGILNLFDTDPPFSAHNVDNVAGAGWDARVGNPRGRAYQLRATYKFF
jgi:iron complex outermembrane recepter protein